MSLRYSIYKVQTCCFALADSLFILAHSELFVKNFFQVFSNFSEVFRFACCSLSNLAILADPHSFVKNFFLSFANFFRIRHSFVSPASDLRIIAYGAPFVKHYFPIISDFFRHPDEDVYHAVSDASAGDAGLPCSPEPVSDSRFPGTGGMPGGSAVPPHRCPRPTGPSASPVR